MHTKIACKEQPAIHLRHIEEKFGGLTMRKKGLARTQHRVTTYHLADMDGPNIRRRQPRQWYTRVEDKLITEHRRHMEKFTVLGDQIKGLTTQISNMCGHNGNGSRNLFAEHEHQHHAQVHAHQRVNRFKLDKPEFQGCLQPKGFLVTQKIKLKKIPRKEASRKMAEVLPRETVKLRSPSIVEEEDGFIEEDCLIDWASPPIYDTYPDKEVSSIHQVLVERPKLEVFDLEVDFFGVRSEEHTSELQSLV